ncbi:hypothetical protein L0F81_02780 [Streptomyces tricolor]|uniref:Uncharacterized protein n=1 Tax=Streptomyces tricolor TaxID=68277 RepID=A0ABS9J9I6_9ACTN|nr:hypothetical protein [Streptomyces tricolor]MCG0062221.1 hypothetical protein [Streptomyces tricolor]
MHAYSTIIQPLTVDTVQAIRQDCHTALYAPPQQPARLVQLLRRLVEHVRLLRPHVADLVQEELRGEQQRTGLLVLVRADEVLGVTRPLVPLWERVSDLAVSVRALLNMLQLAGKLPAPQDPPAAADDPAP